ncbi:MAG TPA: hypothetical protein PLZ69_00980 [Candidatus Pacearchaeota archaeon]|nr:hypothetical protein [Candidatus Pacearchaeota archaeon]
MSNDLLSGCLGTIDITHKKIHDSNMYICSMTGTNASNFQITTPAGFYANFEAELATSAASSGTFQEGAKVTGGSDATIYNLDRGSANTSGVTIKYGVTISVAGTTIQNFITGAGSKPSNITGGSSSSRHEWILKPSTTYAIALTITGTWVLNIYFYKGGN